jgi:hypothetical protein
MGGRGMKLNDWNPIFQHKGIWTRIGKFRIAAGVFNQLSPKALQAVFEGMVVLEVSGRMGMQDVEYLAYHPSFREIQEGAVPPEYEIELELVPGVFANDYKVKIVEKESSVADRVKAKMAELKNS